MDGLHIRSFQGTDADYDTLVEIDSLAWVGEPLSKEGLRHDDEEWDDDHLQVRAFVEVSGVSAAYFQYSETPWAYEPDKYFIKIMVRPVFQGLGIGKFAYDHILQALSIRGARLLTATTREDQPRALRFLKDRGFQQVIRELESRLDVATFDRTAFEPTLAAVTHAGITIHSIRDMQTRDPNWLRKWYDLRWAIIPDMPTSEEFTQESIEAFEASLSSPHIDLDAAFVAIDTPNGQWVGMSSVHVYPEDETTLYVGNTGVIRAYRQRGIALALKVHTIDFAKMYGADEIIGENEENNPMYKLNEKLGFRFKHAWLGFEKKL